MQKDLHDFRKEIDACIKKAGELRGDNREITQDEGKMQREITIAYTKLQEAKMWAGKCLEAIGSPFPKELRDEAK